MTWFRLTIRAICWVVTVTAPATANPPTRVRASAVNPESGAQPETQPADRNQQRQRQHHHTEGGAAGKQQLATRAHPADGGVPALCRAEHEVDDDDGEAGQQRGEHRPGEAAMRLEHSGEHDADSVQRQLRREDPQHPDAALLLGGGQPVAKQSDHRPGGEHHEQRERDQQGQRPGQQRPGGPGDGRPVVRRDRAGQQRYDEAGQRSPATISKMKFGTALATT